MLASSLRSDERDVQRDNRAGIDYARNQRVQGIAVDRSLFRNELARRVLNMYIKAQVVEG